MKKTIIFLTSFLLLIALAGCEKKQDQNKEQVQSQQKNEKQNQEKQQNQEQSQKQSLQDLMKLGKNTKCTWQGSQVNNQMAKGTVYVAGEKFLQEIEYDENGQKMKTYAISDGQWMYTWSNNNKEGIKMKLEDLETDDSTIEGEMQETQGESYQSRERLQQDYDFQCENWNKDEGKFTPPSDVKFQDMSGMMQQMEQQGNNAGQTGNQGMKNACDLCDSLPASAKGECLKNCQ